MKDVNKVILVGRLGTDPILRKTNAGMSVANFPLATSRKFATEGSELPTSVTQWHSIVCWGKSGEACAQYLKKGTAVYVEGSIRTSKYTDKEGLERYSFEIHAEDVSFLSPAKATPSLTPAQTPELAPA